MSRKARIVIGLLSVLVVGLVGIFVFLRYEIRKSFPLTDGKVSLPGLESRVEVFRDQAGIPMIVAASEHDLMFATGFVHAQDRLWQMDIGRRAGEGRLSEIFGAETVPFDKMFRIVGIAQTAGSVAESLTEESRNRLQWYANGVNAYLAGHEGKLPVEFDMLRYDPEPWTVVNSLTIAQMMAWELNLSWWTDLTFGTIAGRVSPEKFRDILPGYPSDVAPTVPAGAMGVITDAGSALSGITLQLNNFLGLRGTAGGSNAWVVAPQKSASGRAILANDTHLHIELPSRWYQLHMKAPGYDVGGMSVPGIPGVVAGHNRQIAWGVTNMMADESDFYIEQVDSSDTTRYLYDGKLVPFQYRPEEIRIRDEAPVEIMVRSTHHGPVVSDIHTPLQKSSPPFVASMRWNGYEISDRTDAFNRINRASGWKEFLSGVSEFSGPGQNFVYADSAGNIGFWCGVRLPIRGEEGGLLPLTGWTRTTEWKGFVPFDKLPHLFNPPEGFIATANNKIADDRYPYYISDIWEPPARIQRLREVLGKPDLFSVEDFERLQNDRLSVFAREMTPFLLEAWADSSLGVPDEERILEYFRNWNFEFTANDISSTIFNEWLVRLYANIYLDEMGADLFHDFLILGNVPMRVTTRLIEEGTSEWFDDVTTPPVENRKGIIRKSLIEALSALRDRSGPSTRTWRWGEFHTVTLRHPFGLVKPLDRVFNRGPFPVGGGPSVLMSGEYDFNDPFDVTVASSFRMIFDFAHPEQLRSVLPSGQSGQVFNDRYDDQTRLWLNGLYRTVRCDIPSRTLPGTDHLILLPQQ